MISDYHMHSYFSGDSKENPENNIKQAIALGMKHICFTDHQDFNFKYKPGYFDLNCDKYFEELIALKEKYKSKINIGIGLEIGLEPHLTETTEKFCNKKPYDFIIASTHLIEGLDPYYPEYFDTYGEKEGFRRYFEFTLKSINQAQNFDVFGHIDYIKRYAPNKDKNYILSEYMDIIDEILKALIQKGKGIEINTAPLYKGFDKTNPQIEVIKRYKELGGEIITVGSDAHISTNVGYGFDIAKDILIHCGYNYYNIFINRKAEYVDL